MATEKLISANSLRNAFRKRMIERFDKDLCADQENCKTCYPGCSWLHIIDKEPAVDAVEVVHGRWEPIEDVKGFVRCSVCHDCNIYDDWPDGKKWNYCPNCGAKMDGDGNG